jgi:hypothetical protein
VRNKKKQAETNGDAPSGFVTSRRGFLAIAGVGAAGVALAACGGSDGDSGSGTAGSATSTTPAAKNVDVQTAQLAAGLEVLAVQTYAAALDAATANKLGAVPPAVAEYVTTAKSQHQAALDKWNGVLKSAGEQAVTMPNATLKPKVDAAFAQVTDVGGAAALALMLEQIAAATYQKAIPTLTSKDAINLAGSIQVIDAQHAAVLLFVSGQYPVPDTFAKTTMAA